MKVNPAADGIGKKPSAAAPSAPQSPDVTEPVPWAGCVFPVVFAIVMSFSAAIYNIDTKPLGHTAWIAWYAEWVVYAVVCSAALIAYHLAQLRRAVMHDQAQRRCEEVQGSADVEE